MIFDRKPGSPNGVSRHPSKSDEGADRLPIACEYQIWDLEADRGLDGQSQVTSQVTEGHWMVSHGLVIAYLHSLETCRKRFR